MPSCATPAHARGCSELPTLGEPCAPPLALHENRPCQTRALVRSARGSARHQQWGAAGKAAQEEEWAEEQRGAAQQVRRTTTSAPQMTRPQTRKTERRRRGLAHLAQRQLPRPAQVSHGLTTYAGRETAQRLASTLSDAATRRALRCGRRVQRPASLLSDTATRRELLRCGRRVMRVEAWRSPHQMMSQLG